MTETTFSTTQLDFSGIKEELKTYFRRKSEFNDYDFDASGLDNILDVLAYNTHFNALLANFSLNEAYLSSAQLRGSVVSIAQSLGYNIRSRSAAIAYVNLSLNLQSAGSKPTSIVLPIGTKFTASVDGISHTFQTRSSYTATDDGSGIYNFITSSGSSNIPIYEGVSRTKIFIVQEDDERQIFVIPDETLDSTQITVKVYDTYSSTSYTSYTDIVTATAIEQDSTLYRLIEAPNGYYEITFGDGLTTGIKPMSGNKVEVEYLSCVGPDANSATSFTPVSQINVNGTDYTLGVNLVAASSGGATKQSIDSIRHNAPLSFASQRRLVTATDYKTTILSTFASVKDVAAWGGEENFPPNYGVVFVGLLFEDGVDSESQEEIKNTIISTINENLGMLSIDVNFNDPVITYLEISTDFYFNQSLTSLTKSNIENKVNAQVLSYSNDNLNSFSGIFRKSNMLTEIDDISPAILSTSASVLVQQRLTPLTVATDATPSQETSYTLSYPMQIAPPDDENFIVTSSRFFIGDKICSIKNKLGSNKLQIVDPNGTAVVDNIGSFEPSVGRINLVGFAPGVIISGDNFIKISVKPLNDAVLKPLRNYYFSIDETKSYASAIIDDGMAAARL